MIKFIDIFFSKKTNVFLMFLFIASITGIFAGNFLLQSFCLVLLGSSISSIFIQKKTGEHIKYLNLRLKSNKQSFTLKEEKRYKLFSEKYILPLKIIQDKSKVLSCIVDSTDNIIWRSLSFVTKFKVGETIGGNFNNIVDNSKILNTFVDTNIPGSIQLQNGENYIIKSQMIKVENQIYRLVEIIPNENKFDGDILTDAENWNLGEAFLEVHTSLFNLYKGKILNCDFRPSINLYSRLPQDILLQEFSSVWRSLLLFANNYKVKFMLVDIDRIFHQNRIIIKLEDFTLSDLNLSKNIKYKGDVSASISSVLFNFERKFKNLNAKINIKNYKKHHGIYAQIEIFFANSEMQINTIKKDRYKTNKIQYEI